MKDKDTEISIKYKKEGYNFEIIVYFKRLSNIKKEK
jgi:hypothetical protein